MKNLVHSRLQILWNLTTPGDFITISGSLYLQTEAHRIEKIPATDDTGIDAETNSTRHGWKSLRPPIGHLHLPLRRLGDSYTVRFASVKSALSGFEKCDRTMVSERRLM